MEKVIVVIGAGSIGQQLQDVLVQESMFCLPIYDSKMRMPLRKR